MTAYLMCKRPQQLQLLDSRCQRQYEQIVSVNVVHADDVVTHASNEHAPEVPFSTAIDGASNASAADHNAVEEAVDQITGNICGNNYRQNVLNVDVCPNTQTNPDQPYLTLSGAQHANHPHDALQHDAQQSTIHVSNLQTSNFTHEIDTAQQDATVHNGAAVEVATWNLVGRHRWAGGHTWSCLRSFAASATGAAG